MLQHQKQTQYSMLQNKNLFLKTPFELRHLTSSSSTFYYSQPSEGTNNTKRGSNQHNVNTHTLQLPLATNKPTSPAKIILQKLRLQNGSPRKTIIHISPMAKVSYASLIMVLNCFFKTLYIFFKNRNFQN